MNKLIIYLFLSTTLGSYSQGLINFYIEPSTTSDAVDLHTGVYKSTFSHLDNYSVNTIDNTISITMCYINSGSLSETFDYQNFEINLPNGYSNYIINVELYGDDDGVPCSLTNLVDTGVLEFNYPYNPIDKITIPDDTFEAYLEDLGFGDDLANNNLVYTYRFQNIAYLFLSNEFTIESLEGINELKRLKELRFSYNSVAEVDLSSNIMLERLFCVGNPLIQLDLSNNSLLKLLIGRSTNITSLDLSNNISLEFLDIGQNDIATIDLSQNTNLTFLSIDYCQFSNIDVSNNILLEHFIGSHNMISSLDVSNNAYLETLDCLDNQLTSINIDGISDLKNVRLTIDQITSLDLSNNGQLERVVVDGNSITSLNLKNGNNTNIIQMIAGFNNLLYCIEVDDENAANNGDFPYSDWNIGPNVFYSEDCSLGHDDFLMSLITIFPNPAIDILYISSEGVSIEALKVYSMSGHEVLASKSNTTSIDVSNLSEGIYFIEITTLKGKIVQKLIKNKS